MNSKTEKIAEHFVRLLPLVYNRLNKLRSKDSSVLRQSNLTHLQLHILEELFQTGEGISMTVLAQHISISKQQLTPLITNLVEMDYVNKSQDPRDRRSVKLLLTEKGKVTVMKHWEEFYRLFSDRIASLNEDDLLDLDFAITKIIRIFEKMDARSEEPGMWQ